MLPDFLIVGAPKCGTTSLARCLNTHSDIFIPKIKEVGFFQNDENWNKGISWYKKHFEEAKVKECIGEATPFYMASEKAAQRIKKVIPEVKLIFLLRNPIIRAHSHYWYRKRFGREQRSFIETIKTPIQENEGISVGQRIDYVINLGFYMKHIKRYLEYFSRDQMCFIIFDDLINDFQKTIIDIQKFIEVEIKNLKLEKKNPAREPKSKLYRDIVNSIIKSNSLLKKIFKELIPKDIRYSIRKKITDINMKQSPKPSMSRETYKLLVNMYQEDITRLSDFLSIDLNYWLKYK